MDRYSLCHTESGLTLFDKTNEFKPLIIDFTQGESQYRHQRAQHEMLAKACGFTKKPSSVIDATTGLGRDSFIFESLGCEVTSIERNDILYQLLSDAIERLRQDRGLEISWQLIHADAIETIQSLSADNTPDVIYLDPMHPERKKSALVKKEMRILRDIVGPDLDAKQLFDAALSKAKKRVVIKLPLRADFINDQKPNIQFKGRSTRFDVYTK